jgi:hypothetical protein
MSRMDIEAFAQSVLERGPHIMLTTSQIKEWRDRHKGKKCPIFRCAFTKPELDHNHWDFGSIRWTLQGEANSLLGKVENSFKSICSGKTKLSLAQVLRNMADYVEQDYDEHPLHPTHRKVIRREFGKLPAKEQEKLLDWLDVDVAPLRNQKDRADAFLKATIRKPNDHELQGQATKGRNGK